MISPTGLGVRRDPMGRGEYGTPRRNKIHDGTDYICIPGQRIVMPIGGEVVRIARPYAKGEYSGVFIQGKNMALKLFYLSPYERLIGDWLEAGEPLGIAQDISEKYGVAMTPHIHLRICSFNPDLLINDFVAR